MIESILDSTKKILGVDASYTAFDLDIITHINTAFNVLTDLGVGPTNGFMISDNLAVWGDFLASDLQLNRVKTYIYLKVRMLFDPPSTSYHMDAMRNQLEELESRISMHREATAWVSPLPQTTTQ